jgi:hypothetical protein
MKCALERTCYSYTSSNTVCEILRQAFTTAHILYEQSRILMLFMLIHLHVEFRCYSYSSIYRLNSDAIHTHPFTG